MPKLIDYYEANPDRDRYEIIAFHDKSAADFAELDEKVAKAKEKYWDGRELPFPVLLDPSGATIKQFDIHAFPTLILFDPEGRLFGKASLDTLKEALEGKVSTPKPLKRRRKPA